MLITYSASAIDHRYAMALLWGDEDADILDPASWHKKAEPVFTTAVIMKPCGARHLPILTVMPEAG